MGLFDFLKKKELAKIKELEKQVAELSQYKGIIDVQEAISEQEAEFESRRQQKISELTKLQNEIHELSTRYKSGLVVYEDLVKEISIYRENLEFADFGVYEPHFEYDDPEEYQIGIEASRHVQKDLIKKDEAVCGGEGITWNNSLSQGSSMVKKMKKLMLRAFNGECDSFISSVRWNNADKMLERMRRSYDAINKTYESQGVYISEKYFYLKEKELRLTHEYREKKAKEREDQRITRELMREEEKARREIEAAIAKAQKEEETYQKALEKARQELQGLDGHKLEAMQRKIAELEARVQEAEANKERALSMAQQTKRGHVYIISNIGSFGENVYKIGMTRRLDPLDRVRELGDASVPFPFDVHAMIFSEDAPSLEAKLHRVFRDRQTNKMNPRKEFFNVTLDEIAQVVKEENAEIVFTKIAEAADYRQTKAIERKEGDNTPKPEFSTELFS